MRPEIVTIDTPSLGDRSYVVHDGSDAFVVDPQRDIDRVLEVLDGLGVRLSHVFETHVHNDYVSGGLALARRTGAVVVTSSDDDLRFEHLGVDDDEAVRVGSMTVRARHTPGHTPTHLAYEVTDSEGTPVAVFTGGSMLYGTVGRTDLLGDDHTIELTRRQWHSVRELARSLPADVAVHPTHGFGSFCSAQSGSSRASGTIADERTENLAVKLDDPDEFVRHLLEGLSDHPTYYAHMSLLNRAGAAEADLSPVSPVEPHLLRARLEAGEWVIDLRNRRAFAGRHLVGSAGFDVEGPFLTYVGWLIPWGSPITLIGATAPQVAEAQRQLVRIGIDRPAGAAIGDVADLAAGHPVSGYRVATFEELARELDEGRPIRVVDVRRSDEYAERHLPNAVNLPIHQLLEHLHHVPAGRLWVHCASGARAAIAASLLARAGFDVVLVDDELDNAFPARGLDT